MKNYITRIRDLRTDKDLNQTELAKILNITQTAVSKIELGQRDINAQTIIKLCIFFNVSADYLLGFTDDPTPKRKKDHNKST